MVAVETVRTSPEELQGEQEHSQHFTAFLGQVASSAVQAASNSWPVIKYGLAGAAAGLFTALHTPAHVEIAGSEASVWLQPGHTYDQLDFDRDLTGRIATPREVGGEPIGVHARLTVNPATLQDNNGAFNPSILPVYAQLFSDSKQLSSDIATAMERHFITDGLTGGGLGLIAWGSPLLYREGRKIYNKRHGIDQVAHQAAHAHFAPEKRFARRTALGLAGTMAMSVVAPASMAHLPPPTLIHGDKVLANTRFSDIEISGLLKPLLVAGENYIQTYVADTDKYYAEDESNLETYLKSNPVQLPTGDTIVNFGYVTDRHCNVGMDRNIIALMKHYGIKLLTSGGDDMLNGSFSFESACTKGLAEKSKKAGITDLFGAGNHESPMSIQDEAKQGIKVFDGKLITVNGINFISEPDPRASRFGHLIVPFSNEAQAVLLKNQGKKIGELVCAAKKKTVVILHDPVAGNEAIKDGCGYVTLALGGHFHRQVGPASIALPDSTRTAAQFVEASSGGAPPDNEASTSLSQTITVGPLSHPAEVTIVSHDILSGNSTFTIFTFNPDKTFAVHQYKIDITGVINDVPPNHLKSK